MRVGGPQGGRAELQGSYQVTATVGSSLVGARGRDYPHAAQGVTPVLLSVAPDVLATKTRCWHAQKSERNSRAGQLDHI